MLKNGANYVTSGGNQINPWGFIEKTLNMLTFYDANICGIYPDKRLKESKPLRDKFKFVMIKIIEKWLTILRGQQKYWDIEKKYVVLELKYQYRNVIITTNIKSF